jgi:hypothetical protein
LEFPPDHVLAYALGGTLVVSSLVLGILEWFLNDSKPRFAVASVPLALSSTASHLVYAYWAGSVFSKGYYSHLHFVSPLVLYGVLAMRGVNVLLVLWFIHAEYTFPHSSSQRKRSQAYLSENVKALGVMCALAAVRLKVLAILCCGAFNFRLLTAPFSATRTQHRLFLMSYVAVVEDVPMFCLTTYVTMSIGGLSYQSLAAISLSGVNIAADGLSFLLYCFFRSRDPMSERLRASTTVELRRSSVVQRILGSIPVEVETLRQQVEELQGQVLQKDELEEQVRQIRQQLTERDEELEEMRGLMLETNVHNIELQQELDALRRSKE